MKIFKIFTPLNPTAFKHKLIDWLENFEYYLFLDSCNRLIDRYGKYSFICGASSKPAIIQTEEELKKLISKEWLFGGLSYHFNQEYFNIPFKIEKESPFHFPSLFFFQPDIIIFKKRNEKYINIIAHDPEHVFNAIVKHKGKTLPLKLKYKIEGEQTFIEYKQKILNIQEHIKAGDVYELNHTQSFFLNFNYPLNIASYFKSLTQRYPVPFAALLRLKDRFVLVLSPERYLNLNQSTLTAQPIKGTIARGKSPLSDKIKKINLQLGEKYRAENVMIVDLWRNDLYQSCELNSVSVPYLFEAQAFKQLYHLVSTIQGKKREEISGFDAIKIAFPTGSMTGAPKKRAIEIIEEQEKSPRGLYSGCLGFFEPNSDYFDFNVVIRGLIGNLTTQTGYIRSGGAITIDSSAEEEYKELFLKIKPFFN